MAIRGFQQITFDSTATDADPSLLSLQQDDLLALPIWTEIADPTGGLLMLGAALRHGRSGRSLPAQMPADSPSSSAAIQDPPSAVASTGPNPGPTSGPTSGPNPGPTSGQDTSSDPGRKSGSASAGYVSEGVAQSYGQDSAASVVDDYSDQAVGGAASRTAFGVTGAGIKVGILSDSFDLLGGYAADVADGALPAGVDVLQEGRAGSDDEGRAMAELIHRIAPGAQLMFHTAMDGEANFAAGINALVAAGCNVIVDDVNYFAEPFYQDGDVLQKAVENAIAKGVSYFTSASNEGTNFLEASFTPVAASVPGLPGQWTVENFAPSGSAAQPWVTLSLPAGGSCAIDLQWDQPFASIGQGGGSTDSLAMVLCDSSGNVVASAGQLDVNRDPLQVLQMTNRGAAANYRLYLLSNGVAAAPDQFKFIVYGNATIDSPLAGIGSGTVTGHELVPGVNTVGAIDWSATPAFGGSDMVEDFSSVGPGEILFDAAGNRLAAPDSVGKVDFVAPDGSSTSVFAPFFGTSAAAPDAAAVAALMLQADPSLSPWQVTSMLEASAIPVLGPADSTGAGLIQAGSAVALATAAAHH